MPVNENRTSHVGLRCPDGLLEMIDKDVEESNEFTSRSDWIVCAIREYLRVRKISGGGGNQIIRERSLFQFTKGFNTCLPITYIEVFQMTTINVKIFGKTHRYDFAPIDIINNVCEGLANEYEVRFMDGWIEEYPSQDVFCDQCYNKLVSKKVDLYLDGMEITIETPTEVRFYSEVGIKEIAKEWYNRVMVM